MTDGVNIAMNELVAKKDTGRKPVLCLLQRHPVRPPGYRLRAASITPAVRQASPGEGCGQRRFKTRRHSSVHHPPARRVRAFTSPPPFPVRSRTAPEPGAMPVLSAFATLRCL